MPTAQHDYFLKGISQSQHKNGTKKKPGRSQPQEQIEPEMCFLLEFIVHGKSIYFVNKFKYYQAAVKSDIHESVTHLDNNDKKCDNYSG